MNNEIKKTPNEYFDKIFCINLDKRLDKWNTVKKRFDTHEIKVERVSGIDGDFLIDEYIELLEKNKINNKIKTSGALAILKTFLLLFKDIIKDTSLEKILIFEDDVLFHKNFIELFDASIKNINPIWKIWYLGGSQRNLKLMKYNDMFNIADNIDGCFAMALTRNCIIEILNAMNDILLSPIDTFIKENLQKNNEEILISNPVLCAHDYGYSDNWKIDINEFNLGTRHWRKVNKGIYT